jgi:multiple sugar transport system ATP-binding protein
MRRGFGESGKVPEARKEVFGMAGVTLEGVTKVYGEDVIAVREMSLDVENGEFIVFVGPSGCGKSTALRMIAGLEEITRGKVFIGDQLVNELPPRDRDVAMVFQNYALYPHMNVRQNMGFALKLRKMDKQEIAKRVEDAAKTLGIERLLDRKPKALSGGQRQRVALGRAIVREPRAFLMDEPLSNLDAKLRVQMRTEIAKLHNRIGTTTIYVTHDQTEAMTMADRIVVLKDGVVQQVASPREMYERPLNVFVAGFIGSPAMNFIRARLERAYGEFIATFGRTRIPLSPEVMGKSSDLGAYTSKEVILGIRPEHLQDARLAEGAAPGGANAPNTIEVEPQVIESMGSEKYVYFGLPEEHAARLDSIEELTGAESAGSADNSGDLMVARVPVESEARLGEAMRLAINAARIRLFDPDTEKVIL